MKVDDIVVVWGDPTLNYVIVPDEHDVTNLDEGDMFLVAENCPARNVSGAGGQSLTACGWCGDMMSGTGGSRHDGVRFVPVVLRGIAWMGDGTAVADFWWYRESVDS